MFKANPSNHFHGRGLLRQSVHTCHAARSPLLGTARGITYMQLRCKAAKAFTFPLRGRG